MYGVKKAFIVNGYLQTLVSSVKKKKKKCGGSLIFETVYL